MSWAGWATVQQIENANKKITAYQYTAQIQDKIDKAKNVIITDLNRVINFDLVPDEYDSDFPIFLNLLTQYKASELILVSLYGAIRKAEEWTTDVTYWKKEYEKLLKLIISGSILLTLPDGTSISGSTSMEFVNEARAGVKPPFGFSTFGEFLGNDELADERSVD